MCARPLSMPGSPLRRSVSGVAARHGVEHPLVAMQPRLNGVLARLVVALAH
jgi:hypothetical protein